MKHLGGGVAAAAISFATAAAAGPAARDYPVRPVPFTAVHLTDAFWLPRIETNRTVSVPFAFEKCEESKRVYHFERAAAALRGESLADKAPPGYPFDDTDLYKVIEGAAYTLSGKQFIINSLHVVTGAAVLGTSLVLTLRSYRPKFALHATPQAYGSAA